ncbi:cytochrome P450 [Phytohabitans sp. ZYX-F-186]|uniref:Cytochrome P450 n=1 Tax=Phytohabitans maris TaxID=3071409 RepID=A0ABU0ZFW8_9ACTN|nr:cytochrome P450 [Phytohabitans sp. ZYX-F-186]MDQ7905944.1 cytochrome P450 [Phytohabitans sp. ZYX-F-186]
MDALRARCPVAATLVDHALYGQGTPHAIWADLRRDAPVLRQVLPDGRAFWSVTSYRGASEVLRDTTTFTSERGTLLYLLGRDDPAAGRQLVATDPPRHTVLRTPIQRVLAAKPVAAMRERLREPVCDTLAPLADGALCDLAERLRHLAVAVMGTLLDLPAQDWPRLADLSIASVAPEDPVFGRPGAGQSVLEDNHRELLTYFHDVVRLRRAHPGSDLVSLLIGTRWDGRLLNQAEVVSNCYSLLLGGSVTMSQVPATTLAELMGTTTLDRWAADPSLLAGGVEEALRWATPNTHFMRYAVQDVELGGQCVNAGDAVVVWLASANRDEDVFSEPATFDVRRSPNKHLAFGIGPHYCVGHNIVRETLKLFFAELFSRFTDLAPAGPGVRLHSHTISGWAALPITARARTPHGLLAY